MSDPRRTVAGAVGVDPTYPLSERGTFSRYVKRQRKKMDGAVGAAPTCSLSKSDAFAAMLNPSKMVRDQRIALC